MEITADYIDCTIVNYESCHGMETNVETAPLVYRPGVNVIRLGVYLDDRLEKRFAYEQIRKLNEIFKKNGIQIHMEAAFVEPVDIETTYDALGNIELAYDLKDWHQYSPFYEKAWLVDKYEADMVHVLLDNTQDWEVCGAGWQWKSEGITAGLTACYSDNDVATIDPDKTISTEYIFAHEIGHQLGMAHNREDNPKPPVFEVAYGYMATETEGTIMSYAKNRVPYYSNRWVEIDGVRYGDSEHRGDMAINASAPSISLNYETYGPFNYPQISPEWTNPSWSEHRFWELLPTVSNLRCPDCN